MIECIRDDSFLFVIVLGTYHCVSLATARLSVSEDGSIIALKCGVNDWWSALLVDSGLHVFGIGVPIAVIEGEHLRLLGSDFGISDLNWSIFLFDKNNNLPLLLLLMWKHGTAPNHNLNAFGVLFNSDFFLGHFQLILNIFDQTIFFWLFDYLGFIRI